jgi:hypothetical protein
MSGREPSGIGGNDRYVHGPHLAVINSFHTQFFRVVCNADVFYFGFDFDFADLWF